jgi:hypothetical protein
MRGNNMKGAVASSYGGLRIDLKDVEVWDDFITCKDVEKLWEETSELESSYLTDMTAEDTDRVMLNEPVMGGINDEMGLEKKWATIQAEINLALLRYAQITQNTPSPRVVIMASGQNALWVSPEAERKAKRKRPDYASYEIHWNDEKFSNVKPTDVFNRIPGDAKKFPGVCRDKLPPDGRDYNKNTPNVTIRNVLSQIHGYMDRHEARYGYIITNEELICFRRSGKNWGKLDISPAFRHNVEADREKNILNSKYVLFYFHAKYATSDHPGKGWRIQAYGLKREKKLAKQNEKEDQKSAAKGGIFGFFKDFLQPSKLWPRRM